MYTYTYLDMFRLSWDQASNFIESLSKAHAYMKNKSLFTYMYIQMYTHVCIYTYTCIYMYVYVSFSLSLSLYTAESEISSIHDKANELIHTYIYIH